MQKTHAIEIEFAGFKITGDFTPGMFGSNWTDASQPTFAVKTMAVADASQIDERRTFAREFMAGHEIAAKSNLQLIWQRALCREAQAVLEKEAEGGAS